MLKPSSRASTGNASSRAERAMRGGYGKTPSQLESMGEGGGGLTPAASMSRRTLLARAAGSAAAFAAWNLAESVAAAGPRAAVRRYEYLFPDGALEVYDIDRGFNFVKRNDLPTERGVRGACACARRVLAAHVGSDDHGCAVSGARLTD